MTNTIGFNFGKQGYDRLRLILMQGGSKLKIQNLLNCELYLVSLERAWRFLVPAYFILINKWPEIGYFFEHFSMILESWKMKMGSGSYGSVLAREPRHPFLVEILCRAWCFDRLGEVLNFYLTEANWPSKHRVVTGDYSYHDQHPVFIPAFRQNHFYWHEWLTSSSLKTEICHPLWGIEPPILFPHDLHANRSAIQAFVI